MQQLNGKEVKEKILHFLNEKGPSLPVQVAKYTNLNTLFASAFLSELASEGSLKISDMKVGGSPLYYTENKKEMLANFSQYLNSKEREAFNLLKQSLFLEDEKQHPAIRVALRGLKDFAFPINKENKIIWRYYLIDESSFKNKNTERLEEKKELIIEQPKQFETKKEEIKIEKQEILLEKKEDLESIKKELEDKKRELEKFKIEFEKQRQEKAKGKKKSGKKVKIIDESFLNEVKISLATKKMNITEILEFNKKEVLAKIIKNDKNYLLLAVNKKKVEEKDILNAYKEALSKNLEYILLAKGEINKKTKETIAAFKKLESIEKID